MWRLRFEPRSRAEPVKRAGQRGQRVISALEEEEGEEAEKEEAGEVFGLDWVAGEDPVVGVRVGDVTVDGDEPLSGWFLVVHGDGVDMFLS